MRETDPPRVDRMGLMQRLVLCASALRLFPHLLLWRMSGNRPVVSHEIGRWHRIIYDTSPAPGRALVVAFVVLMTRHPEFRNLFYHRTGRAGQIVSMLCRPMPTLYINTRDIGPGLYIQHGFSTIISAARIGRDCWINQQVTIGYSNRHDSPVLGDNVSIHAGAKVIGGLRIGDNVKVGANAVVVKDVPGNVTVVGIPARIVRRDGRRVDEAL